VRRRGCQNTVIRSRCPGLPAIDCSPDCRPRAWQDADIRRPSRLPERRTRRRTQAGLHRVEVHFPTGRGWSKIAPRKCLSGLGLGVVSNNPFSPSRKPFLRIRETFDVVKFGGSELKPTCGVRR
jgi:hypothetical protein